MVKSSMYNKGLYVYNQSQFSFDFRGEISMDLLHGKSRRDPNNGDSLEECRIVDRKFIEISPVFPSPTRLFNPGRIAYDVECFQFTFHSPLLQLYKTVRPSRWREGVYL